MLRNRVGAVSRNKVSCNGLDSVMGWLGLVVIMIQLLEEVSGIVGK